MSTEELAGLSAVEFQQRFPEHVKARACWDNSSFISNFLDYATTRGVELCKRHQHTEVCYKATGHTVVLAGVICGVPGKNLICGLDENHYYPLEDLTDFLAKYFGLDVAAYDQEEQELRQLRGDPKRMVGR